MQHPSTMKSALCGSLDQSKPRSIPRRQVEPPWHLVQTHPNKHDLAIWHLTHQGFQTFMPVKIGTIGRPGHRKDLEQPLFPGYLFVQFQAWVGFWPSILSTVGVKHLFRKSDGYPMAMPERVMLLAREQTIQPISDLEEGQLVRIAEGPFSGQTGFAKLRPDKRVSILLSLLGSDFELTVNRQSIAIV